MADGKFKIAGSTTGNYYVMKNGKRTYFDAHNKPMDENVFLKAENATIDRNNSMRKKEHVDAKSNLVKQYYPGSKTGRYYTVNPKTGQKTYYASNGHPIKESYWLQKEQEAVEAVKNKGKSKGTEKTEKKGFWGKLWDHAKSFGKGVVKSVTRAFTDENGKFSPKQTLKTIGTALAITAIAATAVAAGLPAIVATGLLVGWGVFMGGRTIYYGAKNYANANTYEEKLKATEEMGEGTGEIGQTILFKKGIKGQMRNAAAVSRTAKMEALASGSGRYVASLKGVGAGLKSMVPSPKQMLEGTKQTLNSARKGVKTAYDTVRHPVRTTQKTIQSYKVKNQISEAKTPKDFAEIRKDLESNDILSVKQKEKLYKKLDNADIQQSVSGAKTHEDIAAIRKRVNESKTLSAKQKAKYNKQLDKAAESATHEDLAALRKNATETAANPSAKKSEITKAQKAYNDGIRRSVDRDALTTRRDEIVGDAYNRQAKIDEVAKLKEEELKLLVEQKVYARKHENAEILDRYDNELIQGIKKSEIPEVTKTKLLKDLEEVGVKPLSKESIARIEEARMNGTPAGKELKTINARLKQLDKLQETEFNGLINKAEFKKGSWASRQVKRIRGKKGEYETIEARIKAEVKNPEIREQLLTKLKNKKQLLEDINNLKKHPKKDEYEKLIGRAKDEVSLDLIEKKLANDHHIIKSRTTPKERSDLYRKIFAKQHSINPEKYPNIGAKLEEKRLDAELKKANADLAKAKRELNRLESERDAASAEIDANRATSRSNTNEVRNRNGRIEELKGQIEKLESQKAELQTARDEAVSAHDNEFKAGQDANRRVQETREEVATGKQKVDEYMDEVNTAQASSDGYNAQAESLNARLKSLREQRGTNTSRDDVASIRKQKDRLIEEYKSTASEIRRQEQALTRHRTNERVAQDNANRRIFERTINQREQVASNLQKIDKLNAQSKTSGQTINKLAKKYAEQMKKDPQYRHMTDEQRLNFAREQILKKNTSAFKDSKSVKYPKQSLEDKKSIDAFNKNQSEITRLRQQNHELRLEMDKVKPQELSKEIKDLRAQTKRTEEYLEKVKAKNSARKEEIQELSRQIRENEELIQAKEAELNSQIRETEMEQKTLRSKAETEKDASIEAQENINITKEELTQSEMAYKKAVNERAEHFQNMRKLSNEVDAKTRAIKAKETELQKARSEQGENSQRVQELQNEIREIRRGLPEKQAKLKELQEKYTTAEKNVKNLETAQRTAKRKVENNQKALEEVAAKKPKRGWGAIPTMIVATENVAHTADTLQTGVEALMALAAEDAQEEQQVTEDEQVAETQQETGDDVEQIGDAPEDEATATDETTSDTSTDTSNDSSTPVSDSATPVTGTPSNTPVNGGNSSTPKVEDKKAEDKKVEDKTNTPATEEKKEEKPVTAEEPTVDNDDNNNSVNDITIKTYINGRDESGELRDITPAERLILTEQIQNAKNIDDVALIYSEMRSFNKFDGRRNLRRALKQKRKEIEGKHNNYYARMQRVNNDNATLNVTEADRLLAKTNESSTENLSNMSTVKKKFGMFRSPEYLLKSDNADIGVLNQGTPITDSPVINETNLFAPTDALAKENAAAPETTSEANPNAETAPTLVDSPVENPADATSSDSSVAQVKEETTAPQTDMAQADIPDDEVKHKLDIDNGWGDLA